MTINLILSFVHNFCRINVGIIHTVYHKERELGTVELGGVPLPWVDGGLHLGNNISNRCNGMNQDIKVKRAVFIYKNIELNQEFNLCHPATKVKVNQIYNLHFTGSVLWDLFSKEAIMLENSWSTSVRVMFDLPLQSHRNLIKPVSQARHMKFVLLERFLGFLNQIEKSKKQVPKQLLSFIKQDSKSITGSNLRNILLLTDKHRVEELCKDDIRKMKYHEIEEKDEWKVKFIHEITDVKFNKLEVENFSTEELDEILSHLCTTKKHRCHCGPPVWVVVFPGGAPISSTQLFLSLDLLEPYVSF